MKKGMMMALLLVGLVAYESSAQDGPGGPRGGRMMEGMTPVEASALPSPITTYVKEKYPQAEIRRAMKDKEDNYRLIVVADTTRKMVVFDAKGTFKEERPMMGRRRPNGNNSNR